MEELDLVGMFAKGVTIRHTFEASRDLRDVTTAQVEHVDFADGSTWDAPDLVLTELRYHFP